MKQNGLWAVPGGLVVGAILLYILFGASKTKFIGQWILFHTPGVSQLLHDVEIARFGYLMGTLLESGLTVIQALQSLHDATTARSYQHLYEKLRIGFEEGFSFRNVLPKDKATAALLPPPVQQMVIAGERSGALPATLKIIGSIYEEKSDIATQNLETILEPILLIIVWLGVMGVAIAIIMPIYGLVGGLGVQ